MKRYDPRYCGLNYCINANKMKQADDGAYVCYEDAMKEISEVFAWYRDAMKEMAELKRYVSILEDSCSGETLFEAQNELDKTKKGVL